MRNIYLYDKLVNIFGLVRIHNEGVEPVIKQVNGTLKLKNWGECYAVNCPFCGDSKQHLWISHLWGMYLGPDTKRFYPAVCYRRNCISIKHNRDLFYRLLTGQIDLKMLGVDPQVVIRQEKLIIKAATRASLREKPEELLNRFPPITDLSVHHPAVKYLQQRRYDHIELGEKFGLRVCDDPNHPMFARILIPVYNDTGQIFSWTARSYLESVKPKYYHHSGISINATLYNIQHACKHQDFVVAVEGPFDVFRLHDKLEGRVVGCFGKKISEEQARILGTFWKKVFILFDSDATQEGQRYACRIPNGYPIACKDGKDPDDYAEHEITDLMETIRQLS